MFLYLWRERKRSAFLSAAWGWDWLKRIWTLPSLVRMLLIKHGLTLRGTVIAPSAICSMVEVHGDARNFTVGEFCSIGKAYIQCHDLVTLGKGVVINDRVMLLTGSHDVNAPAYDFVHSPITIGDFAWVASAAIVLKGVTIGPCAVIAAGAVVTRDVAPFTIVAGNPARPIGIRKNHVYGYKPSHWFGPISAWVGRQF